MSARHQIQCSAVEYLAAQPNCEVCHECRGACRDEWGPCNWCGGMGSYPKSDLHMDLEREAACMMAAMIGRMA